MTVEVEAPPVQAPVQAQPEQQEALDDEALLADASQAVLQHVDGTLAAVSEKIYQLLLSADIELSADDIRELLGESTTTNKAVPTTAAAPVLPTVGEDEPVNSPVLDTTPLSGTVPTTPRDENKTTENDHSPLTQGNLDPDNYESNGITDSSNDSYENQQKLQQEKQQSANSYLPPSPVPEYTTTTANTSSIHENNNHLNNTDNNPHQAMMTHVMHPAPSSSDNSSLSSLDQGDNDDVKSIATTATRRELKTRVGSLEESMTTVVQQMQQLNERLAAAAAMERANQDAVQAQHETALQAQTAVIADLERQLQQNQTQLQLQQERAQQVAAAKARLAAAQEAKQALQAKTAALEHKLATLCEVLLQQPDGSGVSQDMASKPVLATAMARVHQATRSGSKTASPVHYHDDDHPDQNSATLENANLLRVLAIFSVVLAAFFLAKAAGEQRYNRELDSAVFSPRESNVASSSVPPPPVLSTEESSAIDEDIPILEDLVQDILDQVQEQEQEDGEAASTTTRVEQEDTPEDIVGDNDDDEDNAQDNDDRRQEDKQVVDPRNRRSIVKRILRGIKANTTKIWGKIKGIGDDIPNLVRDMD